METIIFRVPERLHPQDDRNDQGSDNGHLEMLAWLFDAEAGLEQARGNREMSLVFSRKALILFEFIDNEQKSYSTDRDEKMKEIRRRIG